MNSQEYAGLRVLMISPQPFFSPRGTPLSVYYRTEALCELGIEVDLLTYGQGQDVDIPGLRTFRIPDFPLFGKIKAGPTYLKAFLDIFIFLKTVHLLLTNIYDFVHVHEEAVFMCLPLKPFFKFKLVYDMHSSLPQQLANFDFSRSVLLRKSFEFLESLSLSASDAVLTICPALADYAVAKMGGGEKHTLIENSVFGPVRLKDVNSSELPPLPADLDAKKTIVYCGTFEHYQGIDILLRALSLLQLEMPDARVLLVGGDLAQRQHYEEMANALELEKFVTFTGTVPHAQARRLMEHASVLVSPRRTGINTPLKVYQLLASGLPIVATNISAHTQVFSSDVAFLVEPDAEALADSLKLALSDATLVQKKVEAAQSLYQQSYSEREYRQKLTSMLDKLLGY